MFKVTKAACNRVANLVSAGGGFATLPGMIHNWVAGKARVARIEIPIHKHKIDLESVDSHISQQLNESVVQSTQPQERKSTNEAVV